MSKRAKAIADNIFPTSGTIRRRMFFLLAGMGIGVLLITNLTWLPSGIKEIRQSQKELRQVSVQFIRDQIQIRLEKNETDLMSTARLFHTSLLVGDREGLQLAAQRLLQNESAFEEVGILDEKGKEILRLSRRSAITARDLIDRSASSLFQTGIKEEIHWEPVKITATSEPWVALTVRLHGTARFSKGLVFGVINLRSLWHITDAFKLSKEGRVYVVDETGRLIAAADPSLVLRQLSFADRPLVRQLIVPDRSDDRSFVEGAYRNERGVNVVGTGLLLARPRWGLVIEQPQSVLFTPIRQKIWFFTGLSFLGLLFSFGLAQMLSRRLTGPIVRLQEGAQQIGDGNLGYRVPVETDDEIGRLARQFNAMAEQLHASQEAILSALTIPVMSHAGEMREILNHVIAKVISVTGADAASIRLTDDENKEFIFSVGQGFSEAYENDWPRLIRDKSRRKKILTTGEPLYFEDILSGSAGFGHLLAREGFRSAVYLPLKTSKKTFGLMTLASRYPGRLSSKKAEVFMAIVHQISVALENVHLFDDRMHAEEALRNSEREARRLAKENEVIAEIGRIISSSLNIDEVYERFAEEVRKLIPIDRISINIINPKDYTATNTYISGTGLPDRQKGIVYPLAFTYSEEVRRTRRSLRISEETYQDCLDRFPGLADSFRAGFRSLMATPLISQDEVIGTLHFRSTLSNAYSEKDLKLAERVGDQIAGAIANAQLFVEHKRLAEERRELEERLHRAEKMEALGSLAGGVAHDLNNVLGVLLGYSELMLEKIPEGSPLTTYVTNILASTEKAAAIIQDLLTVARRGVSVSEVVNINGIVSEFLETPVYQKLVSYHPAVTFKTELAPALLNIKGSPVHLEKTVMNLVSNAAEAISGMGEVVIRTENRYLDRLVKGYDTVEEGEYVVVSVSDTGGGIPASDIDKIFEPFYTKKSMGRSGTGLGLTIVWGTVKDHKGYIDVESKPGVGTAFMLYFPVTRAEMTKKGEQAPVEEYMGAGETILVVDDLAGQREIATQILTRLGYRVQSQPSGEDALAYLKTHDADLVILDMIMDPGIDGLETYRRILACKPGQKAIIVSGYSETDRVREALALGASAYVQKPYIKEKFGMAIKAALRH